MCYCLSRPDTRTLRRDTQDQLNTHTHTHTTGERTKLFQYHMNLSACWIKLGVVCVFQKFRHLTVQGNKSKIIHFVGLKIKMMCIFFYINQVSDLLLKED